MKLRLQAKYTLALTAAVLAVFVAVAVTLQAQFHHTTGRMTHASLAVLDANLTRDLEQESRQLARISAQGLAPTLARGDRRAVAEALERLLPQDPDLRWAAALDARGQPLAATRGARDIRTTAPIEHDADTVIVTQPVLQGGRQVGLLRIGFSLDPVKQRHLEMEKALRDSRVASEREEGLHLAALLALLLLMAVVIGAITARRLAQPVRALARQAHAFANGDLNRPLLPVRGHDEIAELAGAFQQMRRSLTGTTVSRDFLHRIIDSLQEGLVVTGSGGEIRLCNRAAAELLGQAPEELTGRRFAELVDDTNLFTDSGSVSVTSALRHPTRGEIPVEISRSSLGSGREQVYVVSDITARQALEQELVLYRDHLEQLVVERTKELVAAIQELESFSYTVSHDLHAPLRAISGFGAALLEDYYDLLGDEGRDYLARINSATVRMGELIDGLLTLSRVARREIHCETVDLSAIASELTAELAATDPRRQATFRIAPGLTVFADRPQMHLLLQNLLGNAWKFSRDQRNALIEVGQIERGNRRIIFVRDNGAGFDASCARGIFQPFNRLHTQQQFPGTGIGLATVQRIVARHGGEVWAEADPGAGAVFYFTLPDPRFVQVEESRVSSLTPLSKSVSSQRPSRTA